MIETEKQVERKCIRLYQAVGCDVVKFSQPHKATGQTRGIADLLVYYKANSGKEYMWWQEVKREGGKQSDWQKKFQAMVESHGGTYRCGGLDVAEDQLAKAGIRFL